VRLVLDAGALIALERNDRAMWRRLKDAVLQGEPPVTHGGIVGQAWRGRGPKQARLATALDHLDVQSLDDALGRKAGELLALSRQRDVVDAALVLLAEDADVIATSDPDDLEPLARAADRHIEIIRV
jgi:hypothetical protein